MKSARFIIRISFILILCLTGLVFSTAQTQVIQKAAERSLGPIVKKAIKPVWTIPLKWLDEKLIAEFPIAIEKVDGIIKISSKKPSGEGGISRLERSLGIHEALIFKRIRSIATNPETPIIIEENSIQLIESVPGIFSRFKNIKVLLKTGSVHRVKRFPNGKGGNRTLIEVAENQFIDFRERYLIQDVESFKQLGFSGKKIKMGSLVPDTRAENFIAKNLKKYQIRFEPQPPVNMAAFFKILEQSKNELVILLGHIEKGAFVIEGASGTPPLKILLSKINKFAAEKGINIFFIGCKSAKHVEAGMLCDVRTDVVLRKLHSAVSESRTYYDFFTTLSSGKDMQFVFSKKLIDDVYCLSVKAENNMGIEIAEMLISHASASAMGLPVDDWVEWTTLEEEPDMVRDSISESTGVGSFFANLDGHVYKKALLIFIGLLAAIGLIKLIFNFIK